MKTNTQIILKKISISFLLLLLCQCCFAAEDTNIIAAGDWSEPVVSSHSNTLHGRLLLCESPKNHRLAAYLELQDCCEAWGSDIEIYCNMNPIVGGCHLKFSDTAGQPLPSQFPPLGLSNGGLPGAHWITLPSDSTVRLRISAYAGFYLESTNDYLMSGTFTVDPPADHSGLDVWKGTINLPPVKIPAKRLSGK